MQVGDSHRMHQGLQYFLRRTGQTNGTQIVGDVYAFVPIIVQQDLWASFRVPAATLAAMLLFYSSLKILKKTQL